VAFVRGMPLFGEKVGFAAERQVAMEVDYIKVEQGLPSWYDPKTINQFNFIEMHNVTVVPEIVSAGGKFSINMEYSVTDSAMPDQQLEVGVEYSILKNWKVVFSEKGVMTVPEGMKYSSKKSGLTATTVPGEYKLKVVVRYKNWIADKIVDLNIK
jgi:hypothetical protein